MTSDRDIRVQTYAIAKLAGFRSAHPIAVALAAILERPFPEAAPPVIERERLEKREMARITGTATKPQPLIDYGFAPEVGAIWIVQDALPDFAPTVHWQTNTWKQMFNRNKTLWNTIQKFVESTDGYSAWHAGRVTLPDDPFFAAVLPSGRAREVIPNGLPIFGTSDGRVWIGLTENIELFRIHDARARVAAIQAATNVTRQVDEMVERIRADPAREYDSLVLRAIDRIEGYGVSPAPWYLIQRVVDSYSSPCSGEASEYRLQEAIHRLGIERLVKSGGFATQTYSLVHQGASYGDLYFPAWLARHHSEVLPEHLALLLGEHAARAAVLARTEVLLPLLDAVQPILDFATPLRARWAEAAAANAPERAEELMRAFTGEHAYGQEAWSDIALYGSREPARFLANIAYLDDDGLMWLLSRIPSSKHGKEHTELLSRLRDAVDENGEHGTTLLRLAKAIDRRALEMRSRAVLR
jgi:hypothetical protein